MPINNFTEREQTIAQLRARIADLEAQERAERDARRLATKAQWKFEFVPVDTRTRSWLSLRDNCGVRAFTLRGTVLNEEEMRQAGHPVDRLGGSGSMNYLVNFATPTPRIIKADGGGRIFIKEANENYIFSLLEAFLYTNSEGGDVTLMILSQPNFNG